MSVADKVERLERRLEKLEDENERLENEIEEAEANAAECERALARARARIDRLEDDVPGNGRPFRPDVRRMDAGDWTHASQYSACEACGCQYWEHPPVPGYAWMHRICDGRLVKL